MEMGAGWAEWGLAGLFLASFLAATILPFSSEAVALAMAAGGFSLVDVFVVASVGNTLGGLTNYGIGRWLPEDRLVRWLRIDTVKAQRWRALVQKRGAWAALLCWLPIIGDPIAIALGLFRAPLWTSTLLMFIGKAARYAVLLAAVQPLLPG